MEEITVRNSKDELIQTVDGKIKYSEWCKQIVESINNGNVGKYKHAELKSTPLMCWVEAN